MNSSLNIFFGGRGGGDWAPPAPPPATGLDLFAFTKTWHCGKTGVYSTSDTQGSTPQSVWPQGWLYGFADVSKIDAGEKSSFEFSEWSLNTNSFRARLSTIYRPPYSNLHPVSLKTFFWWLCFIHGEYHSTPEPLIITGDFNIHINNKKDSDQRKLVNVTKSLLCDTNTASFPRVDTVQLANDFGNFFARKTENINTPLANFSTSPVPSLPATDVTCLKEQFTGFRTLPRTSAHVD